jgi:hypothetical protein
MQDSRLPQNYDTHAHVDQTSAMQEESLQEASTNPDWMAQLLTKVPQLSMLATAFFAAAPLLMSPNTMSGPKHG